MCSRNVLTFLVKRDITLCKFDVNHIKDTVIKLVKVVYLKTLSNSYRTAEMSLFTGFSLPAALVYGIVYTP